MEEGEKTADSEFNNIFVGHDKLRSARLGAMCHSVSLLCWSNLNEIVHAANF